MRKLFTLFVALLATTTLWAYDFQSGDLYYNITSIIEPYTVEVTSQSDSSPYNEGVVITTVTIPETITHNGKIYNVTSIGNHAFYECSSLIAITIPNSVTSIGDQAFWQCSSLTSITIPHSVTSIGNTAFLECSSLTSITLPNSVTKIGNVAFAYCSSLTSIIVESGNAKYDSRDNCNAIIETESNTLITGCKNTTIPNSVTNIGNYAFSGRSSLTSITIPYSVIRIGNYAFYGCSSLTSITIPNSVTNIGISAFFGCSSLTSITIPNNITTIGGGTFSDCSSLTSITIPNSVTSIGEKAFWQCSSLTSITIPYSVTNIGNSAFSRCDSLDTVYVESIIPPTLGVNAFTDAPTSICYIPCRTEEIYKASDWTQYMKMFSVYAFDLTSGYCGEQLYWNYGNTKLTITGNGTMFDDIAECSPWTWLLDSIKTIEFEEGVTHIADYAFNGCVALRELYMPSSIQSIGEYAFGGTLRLYEVTCLAQDPPIAYESSFTNYDAYFHAYCDAQRYYSVDPMWKKFHNVECIVNENTVTNNVTITPSDCEATVVWLSNDAAAAYSLVITKNGTTFCTLRFNKYGQLTNIAFAPSRTHNSKQQSAETTETGYSFTITGLDAGTRYDYQFSVLNDSNESIDEYFGDFTTHSATAVDNISSATTNCQKLLRDGQLLILRDGVEYTIMGQKL